MSAYEQHIEPPDRKWQYLLFAAEPYETIGFKLPSREIDKVLLWEETSWVVLESLSMFEQILELRSPTSVTVFHLSLYLCHLNAIALEYQYWLIVLNVDLRAKKNFGLTGSPNLASSFFNSITKSTRVTCALAR
jgi:hypothetical protein